MDRLNIQLEIALHNQEDMLHIGIERLERHVRRDRLDISHLALNNFQQHMLHIENVMRWIRNHKGKECTQ